MTESDRNRIQARQENGFKTVSLLGLFAVHWILSGAVLWLAYDMKAEIQGGFYARSQACALVFKMGLIITMLTCAIWLLVDRSKARRTDWRLGWNAAWKTWIVLAAYTAVVLVRRQLWTPSQGLSDSAQFLPIVGYTNSQFLAESRWLSFLIQVVPIVGLISGSLYMLRARVLRMWERV